MTGAPKRAHPKELYGQIGSITVFIPALLTQEVSNQGTR